MNIKNLRELKKLREEMDELRVIIERNTEKLERMQNHGKTEVDEKGTKTRARRRVPKMPEQKNGGS